MTFIIGPFYSISSSCTYISSLLIIFSHGSRPIPFWWRLRACLDWFLAYFYHFILEPSAYNHFFELVKHSKSTYKLFWLKNTYNKPIQTGS